MKHFSLFIFITSLVIYSCSTNYNKLFQKEKYVKIEKKLVKKLPKKPESIELLFFDSKLKGSRNYAKYDILEAQREFIKAKVLFGKADSDYQEKLEEKGINTSTLFLLEKHIYSQGFIDYLKLDSESLAQEYITEFSNADIKLITSMKRHRDSIYFDEVKKINTEDSYNSFIAKYPASEFKNNVVKLRNERAYEQAEIQNTLFSYENFIKKYPNAIETTKATERIHELAFDQVKSVNTIESYEHYITSYPSSKLVNEANNRIHALAYELTSAINTINAYKSFMYKYPKSKQYSQAKSKYDDIIFDEVITGSNIELYKYFIENYPDNKNIPIVQDSLLALTKELMDVKTAEYCYRNFTGSKKKIATELFYEIFTDDNETATLDLFFSKYYDSYFYEKKSNDYLLAQTADNLYLHSGFQDYLIEDYESYIVLAAPRERAFLTLQVLLSPHIEKKDWKSCISIMSEFQPYFKSRPKKFNDLYNVLNAKNDNTIYVQNIGNQVNSTQGSEYIPVISADDKSLFFCGKKRDDNSGGEDIFLSTRKNGIWSKSAIVNELSEYNSNDAPLSISADNTTMLMFRNGEIFVTNLDWGGWGEPVKIESAINSGVWQADAQISSDRNVLLFSAIRSENYNYYVKETGEVENYHGENSHASDIYISQKNAYDQWSEPENIGSTINTIYCDRSPFLHPDMKTLYFSSSGHGGMGSLDVFMSTRLADSCWNCWSAPKNLGKEINTAGREWGFVISTNGERAYFSKTIKTGEEAQMDIVTVNLPSSLKPSIVAQIRGKLVDSNNKPVKTKIKWEDLETNTIIGTAKTDPNDGSYFIVLPVGKNYGYFIEDSVYFPLSRNLDLRNSKKIVEITNDIKVFSKEEIIANGQSIEMNNIFFDPLKSNLLNSSKPELIRIANFIKNNNLKVELSGHTDNQGTLEMNQKLSEDRAESVRTFLLGQGCYPEQLISIGYGYSRPIDTNNTEEGRAKNRRVEFKVLE